MRLQLSNVSPELQTPSVHLIGVIGMIGFNAGPYAHIVDPFGLADALIARLPTPAKFIWRIGHFDRPIPYGYVRTFEEGSNRIEDKQIAEYYGHLSPIIKGDLWSWHRFVEIIKMNFGAYDYLIDAYVNTASHVTLADLSHPKPEGTPWDAEGNYILPRGGIDVDLGRTYHDQQIEISLDHNDGYLLIFYRINRRIAELAVPPNIIPEGGLFIHRVEVPQAARRKGYDRIQIIPTSADELSSIGHLTLSTDK